MNWYKKSQRKITIKDIIWAIDKIIIEQYDFSVEELQQASERLNQPQEIAKAAQTVQTRKKPLNKYKLPQNINPIDYKVLDLLDRGISPGSIGKKLGLSTPEVTIILKKYFPNKKDQKKYLEEKYEKNILNRTRDLTDMMKKDFNIYSISPEQIAEELNIEPKLVRKILIKNKISIQNLGTERRDRIAELIADIANNWRGNFKVNDIIDEFQKRYNFKPSTHSANSALKLRNAGEQTKRDEASILKAFKIYVNDNIRGGAKIFISNPEKLPIIIDKFFNYYGKNFGFIPPMEQEMLKKMLMTKNQLRDMVEEIPTIGNNPSNYISNDRLQKRVIELIEKQVPIEDIVKQTGITPENITNFYKVYITKRNPFIYNESHPSYFLGNQN